ncbi:MAG: glycosyltransferase [Clostridia bacterium]|nr:glycosyltransferase [Clostridia bacterium]MBR7160965.1 glycosyltransferase [Clostridia bacterium]
MKQPTVSVVIPVYNGARFVSGIVDCLDGQTMKAFEAVFVNDGSTDGTKDVLDSLTQEHHSFSIKVIHQKNGGVSAARNAGLNASIGDFICFIDVDDAISSDYLETLYQTLQASDVRIAVGNITRNRQDLQPAEAEVREYSSVEFLREFLYRGIRFSVCACMFSAECFRESGLRFPEGFRYSEDVYLLWQLFALENRIAEVNRTLYYYYDNPTSAMNSGLDLKRMDAILLMKRLESILAESSPEFSPEFDRYAVARHHWSILWQAALRLPKYKMFREYCSHFEMKAELKKLLDYPEKRISLSSALYTVSPRLYYYLLRLYMRLKK